MSQSHYKPFLSGFPPHWIWYVLGYNVFSNHVTETLVEPSRAGILKPSSEVLEIHQSIRDLTTKIMNMEKYSSRVDEWKAYLNTF